MKKQHNFFFVVEMDNKLNFDFFKFLFDELAAVIVEHETLFSKHFGYEKKIVYVIS